jgi:protein-disulfide isomerase
MQEFPGKVRLVYKDLPLGRHELARDAHAAARCAGAAGRYWAYHDRLYAEQPAFERPKLIRYAADLGLNADAFTRCLETGTYAAAIEADIAQARQLGIRATPSFLVNGRLLVGAHPIENFRAAIADAMHRSPGSKLPGNK